ncbi:formylglycine-generating enzyme family protein [bacterium]|nr:formylglycine-generating enzyme family protein [bacterium]
MSVKKGLNFSSALRYSVLFFVVIIGILPAAFLFSSCSDDDNDDNNDVVDRIVGSMSIIPAGTFSQGSPSTEECRFDDEAQYSHTLTRAVAVMETEVTRQMWADLRAVQSSLPDDPTATGYGPGMNNPVQSITWLEAVLFANLLSIHNGLTCCYYIDAALSVPLDAMNYETGPVFCNFDHGGYRLMTEGEWEYACRAGTTTAYNSGHDNLTCLGSDANLEPLAWYAENAHVTGGLQTHPVGEKLANSWTLQDMHGNVWEWCWDWYLSSYPDNSTDFRGPETGSDRCVRGGSYSDEPKHCRAASRGCCEPLTRFSDIGFRLARTVQ